MGERDLTTEDADTGTSPGWGYMRSMRPHRSSLPVALAPPSAPVPRVALQPPPKSMSFSESTRMMRASAETDDRLTASDDGAMSSSVPSLPLTASSSSSTASLPQQTTAAAAAAVTMSETEFIRRLLDTDSARRGAAAESLAAELLANRSLLAAHAATALRLAHTAPFPDVAEPFARLVRTLESEGYALPHMRPASSFIRQELLPSARAASDPVVAEVFRSAFLSCGRVPHISQVLAMHPSYLAQHSRTMDIFLRQTGPLPVPFRLYIGILASAQVGCGYLVGICESEFRLANGDESWLTGGVAVAPKKLQDFVPVLAVIAQCPWRLTKAHIAPLFSGCGDRWSIGELVSAVVIASTFLALSGVAFGTGVSREVDIDPLPAKSPLTTPRTTSPTDSDSEADNSEMSRVATATLVEKLRAYQPTSDSERSAAEDASQMPHNGSVRLAPLQLSDTNASADKLDRYRGLAGARDREEFDQHSKEYGKFPYQDFSWAEHGYQTVSKLFSNAADLLDGLFNLTYELTYHTLSTAEHVDTDAFRQAVWYYVQLIHGVYHEDYNYHEVNTFLEINVKRYVKLVSCNPAAVTRRDFNHLTINLRPDEKVHVCLLASESRKQVAILYALRAIADYQNSS